MAGRNDEFMESYKHLDKICREIFNNEKGITTYINEMEANRNGAFYVASWNKTLRKLKKYRHIRNIYVHEVGSGELDICTIEDIQWLNGFYDIIMQSQDPLAQYRKNKATVEKKSGSTSKEISTSKEASTFKMTEMTIVVLISLGIAFVIILIIFAIALISF